MIRKAKVLPFTQPTKMSGKQRFVQELFDEHGQSLRRFVQRLGVGESNSQDIVQEVYLRVMRQSDPRQAIRSPFTYLCTIAANLVRDQVRKSIRHKEDMHRADEEELLIDNAPTPDRAVETSRKLAVLKKALLALPSKKRDVLLLNQYEGLSCRQISEKTGIPFRTVQRYLNEALLLCRSKMRIYHE